MNLRRAQQARDSMRIIALCYGRVNLPPSVLINRVLDEGNISKWLLGETPLTTKQVYALVRVFKMDIKEGALFCATNSCVPEDMTDPQCAPYVSAAFVLVDHWLTTGIRSHQLPELVDRAKTPTDRIRLEPLPGETVVQLTDDGWDPKEAMTNLGTRILTGKPTLVWNQNAVHFPSLKSSRDYNEVEHEIMRRMIANYDSMDLAHRNVEITKAIKSLREGTAPEEVYELVCPLCQKPKNDADHSHCDDCMENLHDY